MRLPIIFEEIQHFAINPDFQDGLGPVALFCSIFEGVDKDRDKLSISGEDVGQGFTADLILEASSFLLRKVNFRMEDACTSN